MAISLDQESMAIAAVSPQLAVSHDCWRAFGYKRTPRRGLMFDFLVPKPKLAIEKAIMRELWSTPATTAFSWAMANPEVACRSKLASLVILRSCSMGGTPLFNAVGFSDINDAVSYLLISSDMWASISSADIPEFALSRIQGEAQAASLSPVTAVGCCYLATIRKNLLTDMNRLRPPVILHDDAEDVSEIESLVTDMLHI